MKRLILLTGLCAALLGAVWRDAAESQSRPAPPRRPLEQLRKMSADAEARGLAEPVQGHHDQRHADAGPVHDSLHRRLDRAGAPGRRDVAGLAHRRPAHQGVVWRRRPRVAQVDEPALLRAAGRQLRGDDRGPARRGVRPAARVAERQGPHAHARHHEVEPHAGRAEQQRLRASTASGSTSSR